MSVARHFHPSCDYLREAAGVVHIEGLDGLGDGRECADGIGLGLGIVDKGIEMCGGILSGHIEHKRVGRLINLIVAVVGILFLVLLGFGLYV